MSPYDIHMNCHRLFRTSTYATALYFALGHTGCQDSEQLPTTVSSSRNLKFVEAYSVDVPEPSGLTLSKDNRSLWTVSDSDGQIYQIDLQGNVISQFQSNHGDLEGITTIDDQHLAFIAERARTIIIAQKDGKILQEAIIEIPGSDNSGPEALTYDEHAEQFHIMQESPGKLITMNRQLEEVERRELKFAQDYSSISFDSERKHFWVLSDQSKSIHVLDQDLSILQTFSADVEQMEGIAIDLDASLVYLISDPLDQLYIFEFESF